MQRTEAHARDANHRRESIAHRPLGGAEEEEQRRALEQMIHHRTTEANAVWEAALRNNVAACSSKQQRKPLLTSTPVHPQIIRNHAQHGWMDARIHFEGVYSGNLKYSVLYSHKFCFYSETNDRKVSITSKCKLQKVWRKGNWAKRSISYKSFNVAHI